MEIPGNSSQPPFMEFKSFVEASGLRTGTVERLVSEGKLTIHHEGGVRYVARAMLEKLPALMNSTPVKRKGVEGARG